MRTTLSFALMLWCAGAGCMLATSAHGAAMSGGDPANTHPAIEGMNGLSASMGDHDCCKAHHSSHKRKTNSTTSRTDSHSGSSLAVEQIALPEMPAPSGAMNCCPLTSGSFVVASRGNSTDANDSALTQTDSVSLSLPKFQASPRAYPLKLLNQDQTYLRCCVFLI